MEETKEMKTEVKSERKETVKAKRKAPKKAVKAKAVKKAVKAKKSAKRKVMHKLKANGKVTVNQKLPKKEVLAMKKLSYKLGFKGNLTQLVRYKVLGIKANKQALSAIRKTTRA